MDEKITIGYIAGCGHSGSTLTDLLLGSQRDIASFGELKNLDDVVTGKIALGSCTCGERIAQCDVWRPVLDDLHAQSLPTAAVRSKHPDFHETNQLLFRKLAEVTGKRILVDSSKILPRLKLLTRLPGADFSVRAIHLVRDGRAVAYSHTRKNRDFHDRLSIWAEQNDAISAAIDAGIPGIRVHYEELVSDPVATVRKMVTFLGGDATGAPDLAWAERVRHNVGGNRMRHGETSDIRFDTSYLNALTEEEWQSAWDAIGDKLLAYGYTKERKTPRFAAA